MDEITTFYSEEDSVALISGMNYCDKKVEEFLKIKLEFQHGLITLPAFLFKMHLYMTLYARTAKQVSDIQDLGMSLDDCAVAFLSEVKVGIELK